MSSKVNLIHITPFCEKHIAYCARVSSPHQDNPEYEKLLKYCIEHGHWSIFEMGNMCIEIITSRALSAQILRHKSFSFQEFSQRYAKNNNICEYKARRQDLKNRQNSIDDLDQNTQDWFLHAQKRVANLSLELYNEAVSKNIAKESARFLLPLGTETKLYMNGNIRSWITYINLRTGNGTQEEHAEIARKCKEIFIKEMPVISRALVWSNNE